MRDKSATVMSAMAPAPKKAERVDVSESTVVTCWKIPTAVKENGLLQGCCSLPD